MDSIKLELLEEDGTGMRNKMRLEEKKLKKITEEAERKMEMERKKNYF